MPPERQELTRTAPPPISISAAEMLTAAINKGIDAQGIETLARVYQEMEAKRAEREYTAALLAFQDECPLIRKTSAISFLTKKGNNFNSRFARLSDILVQIRPMLKKHGFAVSFDQEPREKKTATICVLRHIGGHSTRTAFEVPTDTAPLISDQHSAASATSFAERYALQLALGIVPSEDDDGKAAFTSQEVINQQQRDELQRLVDETKSDTPAFWAYAGVQQLDDLPASKFNAVRLALVQRKQRAEADAKKAGEGKKP